MAFAARSAYFSRIFATLVVATTCACTPQAQERTPPPPPVLEAPVAAALPAAEVDLGEAFRDRASYAEVYIPAHLAIRQGHYDLVVHFHGIPKLQEDATARANVSAVIASVNVGTQSGPYGAIFRQKAIFPDMLEKIEAVVRKRPNLANVTRGRLALTGWSSGAAAVTALLANGFGKDADAVLLADGLFAAYVDPKRKTIYQKTLEPVADYVERAKRGETLFVLTHTSIPTDGFPAMPDTTGELLKMTHLEKKAPKSEKGPCSSKVLYEVHEGNAHVTGYDGMLAGDHISQIKHMDESEFSYLRDRWKAP